MTDGRGPWPSFLILGTQKAGTSSLYQWLGAHPDVYMSPVKEPEHFVLVGGGPDVRGPDGVRPRVDAKPYGDPEAYAALFEGVDGERAVGEASTSYLYDPDAPARIAAHRSDMRMVAVLRQPVDRAHSAWQMARRSGVEPLGFAEAVAAEPERIAAGWGYLWRYLDVGRYAAQVRRYRERFDPDLLRIVVFDDLVAEPAATVRDLFAFLGVEPAFEPDVGVRHNPGGIPRSRALHRFLKAKSNPWKSALKAVVPERARLAFRRRAREINRRKRSLDPALRRRLTAEMEPEIAALEALIDRDLSAWRAP